MLPEIDTLSALVPDSQLFHIRPADYFLIIVSYTELLNRACTHLKLKKKGCDRIPMTASLVIPNKPKQRPGSFQIIDIRIPIDSHVS
jgi:hypothetical protein